MPKIISDVRGAVLAAVRRNVAARGWKALEIRSLAASSGVAAGTLYNYFPSREAIAAAAFREDWRAVIRHARSFPQGGSATRNLRAVYEAFTSHRKRWAKLWAEPLPRVVQKGGNEFADELRRCRLDMEQIVAREIGHHGKKGVEVSLLPRFIAGALMHCSADPRSSWRSISKIVDRLVGG